MKILYLSYADFIFIVLRFHIYRMKISVQIQVLLLENTQRLLK